MKALILLMAVSLAGCAHRSHLEKLRKEVNQHEARNLSEIRSELQGILDAHPELSKEKKAELSNRVEEALSRHHELRNQESKIIQHVLKEAVADDTTIAKGKAQRKMLRSIYKQKSDNLFELVHSIRSLTWEDDQMKQEMELLIREFR